MLKLPVYVCLTDVPNHWSYLILVLSHHCILFSRYNGMLPQGDKGRRRSKFPLARRHVSNGVKPVKHHVVKNPQQSEVSGFERVGGCIITALLTEIALNSSWKPGNDIAFGHTTWAFLGFLNPVDVFHTHPWNWLIFMLPLSKVKLHAVFYSHHNCYTHTIIGQYPSQDRAPFH